jgi:hypothetical protein
MDQCSLCVLRGVSLRAPRLKPFHFDSAENASNTFPAIALV